jgi:hypothetical protein
MSTQRSRRRNIHAGIRMAPPMMETAALERAEAIARGEGIMTFYIRRDGNGPQHV